jgi:hypothetical protein
VNLNKSKYLLPPKAFASTRDRKVYNLGSGLVFKKSKTKAGKRDNWIEVIIYRSAPPSLKRYLAKIIDYGPGWLVMEKARTPIPKNKGHINYVRKMVSEFKRYGINAKDILTKRKRKPKTHNLGINKRGQIVVIDYGEFRRK